MRKKFLTALGNFIKRMLSFELPLYFFASAISLCIIAGLAFGFLVQRIERKGPESTYFGETIQSIAASPGALVDAARTLRTAFQQVNPQVKGRFRLDHPDRFSRIVSVDSVPPLEGTRIHVTEAASPGWRIITGFFDIDAERMAAAILLDEAMQVVHVWRLHEEDVSHPEKRGRLFKFPHGFDVLPDGSIFYSFDGGVSLKRVDVHGRTSWYKPGRYHHAITLGEEGKTLWTLRHAVGKRDRKAFDDMENRYLDQLDAETGKTLNTISLADVIRANKKLSILSTRPPSVHDPYHENDVDPLPPSLAEHFPQFAPGDLLVSVRNANLVFVLEPRSQQVKWWRMGGVIYQHDPDWVADGSISIFDNSLDTGTSRIIAIDPKTMATEVTVPGGELNFYSRFRGKHQVLPDGSVLVSSALQGRVLEVSPDKEVVFELVNFIEDETERVLMVSEAKWVPPDFFSPEALEVFE